VARDSVNLGAIVVKETEQKARKDSLPTLLETNGDFLLFRWSQMGLKYAVGKS
jgi:hypothetical protein